MVAPKSKIQDALIAFLSLPTVSIFHRSLNAAEKIDFERHVRKYLTIYHPQAGFEISSTERYTRAGPKAESCIIANKTWGAREVIKFLTGTIVAMTQEEEDFYEAGHDFSILHSSRLDSMCLFLGPARFVNHDCCPNGTFVTQGTSVSIATTKPVKIGEEITVFYSPDYFGPNNADCLCATCEANSAGGYRSQAQKESDARLMSQSLDASSPSQKRNRVDALEIVTDEQTNESSIKAPRLMPTPSNNELSLEDIAKIAYLSSDDEFHSMPEETDDEDIVPKIRRRDDFSKFEIAVDTSSHDSDHPDADEGANPRKVLRPRKSRHDYNVKRQSVASLQGPDEFEPQNRDQYTNRTYCQVCSDELPGASIVEEIWSISEPLGLKETKCRRCDRHSKIYGAAWPKRAPVNHGVSLSDQRPSRQTKRADSPNNSLSSRVNIGAEKFFSTTSIRFPGFQDVLSHWSLLTDGNYLHDSLEPAKAHMRKGALSGPRFGATFPLSAISRVDLDTPDRTVVDQHSTFLNRGKTARSSLSVKNSLARGLKRCSQSGFSQATLDDKHVDNSSASRCCTSCRQKNKKCSLQTQKAQRCERCIRLRKDCESSTSRRQGTSEKSHKLRTNIYDAQANSRGSPLSPDSELAARQVISPHRLNIHPRSRDTGVGAPTSTTREMDLGVHAISKVREGMKKPALTPGKPVIPMVADIESRTQEEDASLDRLPSTTPSSRKSAKPRSRHSWVYVEVHSEEEERNKRSEILEGRTRRESHKIASLGSPAPSGLADIDEIQASQPRKRRRLFIRSDSDSETSIHASHASKPTEKRNEFAASVNDDAGAQQIAKDTDAEKLGANSDTGTVSVQDRVADAKLTSLSEDKSLSTDHEATPNSSSIVPQASLEKTSRAPAHRNQKVQDQEPVYPLDANGETSTLGAIDTHTSKSMAEQNSIQDDVPDLAPHIEQPIIQARSKIRRPRKQMWEYVSITSDDDGHEKGPEILPDRAARRKSAPVYRG